MRDIGKSTICSWRAGAPSLARPALLPRGFRLEAARRDAIGVRPGGHGAALRSSDRRTPRSTKRVRTHCKHSVRKC